MVSGGHNLHNPAAFVRCRFATLCTSLSINDLTLYKHIVTQLALCVFAKRLTEIAGVM